MDFDLKEVFSILDENNEGQIQLRRFVDVANNYYSDAEQLARITKALDPKKTGFINFNQFCHGIAQISSLQGVSLKDVASDLTRRSRENSLVEDSDQRSLKTNNGFDFSSLLYLPNLLIEENQDGSTTTFNEYDVESEEASHTNKLQSTNNKLNTKSKNINQSLNNSQNNQSFSPILDSSVFGDEEEFTGIAEPNSNNYSTDLIHPRAGTPQRIAEVLKRNNPLKSTIPSEEIDQQLQESVDELQKTVEDLTVQKQTTTDRLTKIQYENTDLKKRLLALEDRFQDLEGQQSSTTRSEQQKYAEYINQKDRSFLQEKETLQTRINAIETELKQTQTTNGQMKKDVRQLKEKLEDVDHQLHDSQLRCNDLAEDNEKLLEQLRLQRQQLEQEKLLNIQLAEQLSSDSSRKNFSHTLYNTENIIKTTEIRIQDLDAQVRALKLENEKLKHENDELRERAVAIGIDEGRRLMSNQSSLSYAAELEVLSKDELMSKLREQLLASDRLREYIERMLTVIIENSPQLLEITMNAGTHGGSLGMPLNLTMNQQTQSLKTSSKEIENKSIPSEPLKATESTKSDSLSTSTTTKQSNDNKKAVEKVYDLASKVEGGNDYLISATNTVNTLVKGTDPRVYLKHGNIIQFISRTSGRSIQIVLSRTNQLICNAIGGTGSQYTNACWVVISNQNGHYYFHNNNNFLGIQYGQVVIIPSSINQYPPREAEFRVHDVLGSAHAIYLESVRTPGYFIGFNWNGEPCQQIKIETREKFAQFEIHP
ncbi:unnamed protein product, partial [Rotaria sp. Silwood1]